MSRKHLYFHGLRQSWCGPLDSFSSPHGVEKLKTLEALTARVLRLSKGHSQVILHLPRGQKECFPSSFRWLLPDIYSSRSS